MPDDIYANIKIDRMGNPITKEDVCLISCVELEPDKVHNIIGTVLFLHYECLAQSIFTLLRTSNGQLILGGHLSGLDSALSKFSECYSLSP